MYYSFSITKLQKSKEKSLNLKSYINRIFTLFMSRKALPSVLLHKNEVTYWDTGLSKNNSKSLTNSCEG